MFAEQCSPCLLARIAFVILQDGLSNWLGASYTVLCAPLSPSLFTEGVAGTSMLQIGETCKYPLLSSNNLSISTIVRTEMLICGHRQVSDSSFFWNHYEATDCLTTPTAKGCAGPH